MFLPQAELWGRGSLGPCLHVPSCHAPEPSCKGHNLPGPQQKTPRGCRSTAPCARGARPPPGPFPSAPGACPGSSPSPARGASTKLSLPSLPALGFVCKAPGANISVPPGSRGTRSPVPGPGGGTNAPLADGSPRSASGPVLQDVGVPITQLCRARDLCCHLCPCPHYFVAPSSPAWVRPCSSRSPAPSWAHVCSADFVPWGIPPLTSPGPVAPGAHRPHRKRSASTFSLGRNHPKAQTSCSPRGSSLQPGPRPQISPPLPPAHRAACRSLELGSLRGSGVGSGTHKVPRGSPVRSQQRLSSVLGDFPCPNPLGSAPRPRHLPHTESWVSHTGRRQEGSLLSGASSRCYFRATHHFQ